MTVDYLLWTYRAQKNGRFPVMLRIISNSKSYYRTLGFSFKKSEWDPKLNRVKKNVEGAASVNIMIKRKVNRAQEIIMSAESYISPAEVFGEVFGDKRAGSFTDYLEERGKDFSNRNTRLGYIRVANTLKAFRKNIRFAELTPRFLREYQRYLSQELNLKTNSVHFHFKTIRAALYKAIKEGEFPQEKNPFFSFKLAQEETKRIRLDVDEIKRLAMAELSGWKDRARDFYMFSFAAHGVRFEDFAMLKPGDVRNGVLSYTMGKTGKQKVVSLSPHAMGLIEKYSGGDYLFPVVTDQEILKTGEREAKRFFKSPTKAQVLEFGRKRVVSNKNALVNKFLKRAVAAAGIEKQVSFHTARHSVADMLLKAKAPSHLISSVLGHSKIETTQRYLKGWDQDEADDAFRKINPV